MQTSFAPEADLPDITLISGQEIQSARRDRVAMENLSERDARGTVRGVHVLSGVGIRLPTWHLWYSPQGAQGFGAEAVIPFAQ
jgi:hypothetical protein